MAAECKNILPLLARGPPAPGPSQPCRTTGCHSGCPAGLLLSHTLLPSLPRTAMWNGILVPEKTEQVLGHQTPHQFLVPHKTHTKRGLTFTLKEVSRSPPTSIPLLVMSTVPHVSVVVNWWFLAPGGSCDYMPGAQESAPTVKRCLL